NDEASFIYSQTNGESHNTLTPIARMRDGFYEIDLVLRNNITTAEHPFGLFHTHEEHRHIKKENIGLMEVLGLAVLPGHLKKELSALGNAMIQGRNYRNDPLVSKHADWADKILSQYGKISAKNIDSVLKTEVGKAFVCILENSAVFKRTPEGKDAFMKFIKTFA
ncbi:MAG: galactose-1-phosphate uridylyltransferase, partial [Treponema sp.]|nr:galactose-1-phosphate uridylyltransferase [Treponema sp.]